MIQQSEEHRRIMEGIDRAYGPRVPGNLGTGNVNATVAKSDNTALWIGLAVVVVVLLYMNSGSKSDKVVKQTCDVKSGGCKVPISKPGYSCDEKSGICKLK